MSQVMPDEQPKLNVRRQENVLVVEFEDRRILEETMIAQIGERLSELIQAESEPRVLLDFKNVEHLSSAMLGVLITLNKRLAKRQGRLSLAGIQPQVYEVFKITRLDKLFTIRSTVEAAIQALA